MLREVTLGRFYGPVEERLKEMKVDVISAFPLLLLLCAVEQVRTSQVLQPLHLPAGNCVGVA